MTIAAPKRFLLSVALVTMAATISGCASGNDDGTPPSGSPAAESIETEVAREASDVEANDLREGECMTDSGTAADPSIQVMPCAEPHAFEVFATTELPAGAYPGIGEADAQTQEFCRSEFVDFVGVEYDASALELQYFYPVESEWSDDGGRSAVCLVGDGGAPSTGTLRDTNR